MSLRMGRLILRIAETSWIESPLAIRLLFNIWPTSFMLLFYPPSSFLSLSFTLNLLGRRELGGVLGIYELVEPELFCNGFHEGGGEQAF